MAKIFINAGHGGSDPGAVGYLVEKEVNLKVAKASRDYLVARGHEVLMGREEDVDRTSRQIISMCNNFKPDFAMDCHANVFNGKAKGYEIYKGISGLGDKFAKNIEAEVKALGQLSRGIKTRRGSNGSDYYYFIRETVCPAVICEACFIDHPEDYKFLSTDEKCKICGEAYAKGILKTLGVEDKPVDIKPEAPVVDVDDDNDVYVVKEGDTLWGIAKANNTTVDKLQELNSIDDVSLITIGQKIVLPTTEVKPTKPEPITSSTNNSPEIFDKTYANGKQYVVNSSNGLHLRSGYGTKYASLGVLANNTKVMWYGYYKVVDSIVWRKVKVASGTYNGKVGYVSAQYLK